MIEYIRCEEVDTEHGEEERFKTIGLANVDGKDALITVVYTGEDNLIRIITAWKSTASEQEKYISTGN